MATRFLRPSEVAAKLERAADLIEKHGWFYSLDSHPDSDTLCAGLAISAVSRGRNDDIHRAFCRQLEIDYGVQHSGVSSFGTVMMWNDAQRDRRKVTRALRRCARNVRNGTITSDVWRKPYTATYN